MEFRDLGAQYKSLQLDIDNAISKVLSSGLYIGGQEVSRLEEELASYVGVKHCITCGNGTDALQLALMAWGIGEGDAVFVPDFTFFSSGEVVAAVGATPIFVDVNSRTFNMDPHKLMEAIEFVKNDVSLNPCAVVAVDLFGLPADYPAIKDICRSNNLFLLEDGAQGFGGSIDGKMACSFGDISTTSFFPAKPLGCYGDGGAIFTENDEWADLMRSLAVHGKGSMKYDNVRIGINSRLDAIQAAILRVKLKAFADHELRQVNEAAAFYDEGLKQLTKENGIKLPVVPDGFTSSWAQYTIQLTKEIDRDALQHALKEQRIPTMIYYPKPMHEQSAFRGRCYCSDGCPATVELCERVLSLPMGPYSNEDSLKHTCETIKYILGKPLD